MKNNKIIRVLLILTVLVGLICIVQSILSAYVYPMTSEEIERIVTPILFLLYSFTPLCAIVLAEMSFKGVVGYIHNQQTNLKATSLYALSYGVLLSVISIALAFFVGQLLGANGEVSILHNLPARLGLYIVMGLTYYLLMSIGGEVLWRGFLEQELKVGRISKCLTIALGWWLWSMLSSILFRPALLMPDFLYEGASMLVIYIILSFYLSDVVRRTSSVIASSAIVGLMSSSSLLYTYAPEDYGLLIGSESIVAILSVALIYLITTVACRRVGK